MFGTNSAVASLISNGPAASARVMQWSTAGSTRWQWRANATAESGSNAGSDLQLFSYSDNGTTSQQNLLITRSNGNWTWNNGSPFGNPTYNFTSGNVTVGRTITQTGTYTFTSGVAPGTGTQGFRHAPTFTGTLNAGTNTMNLFTLADTVDGSAAVPNVSYFAISGNYNSGARGDRQLMNLLLAKNTATAGDNPLFMGLTVTTHYDAAESTNPAAPLGRATCLNLDGRIQATNGAVRVLLLQENDLRLTVGNYAQSKGNIAVHNGADDAAHGDLEDYGIAFSNSGNITPGTGGNIVLLQLGSFGQDWPLDTTRTDTAIMQVKPVLGVGGVNHAWTTKTGYGIDLQGVNFTSNAWRSTGFAIDGAGQVSAGPARLTYITGGVKLAVPLNKAVSAVVHAGSGGTNYGVGDQTWDSSGTLWSVTSVGAAGAMTAVTLITAGYYSGANPTSVAVTGGRGINATLDITTQATGSFVLSDAGQSLGFYGATAVAKPTVTGSKGANAALTSLLSALSSLGLLTDSST